MMPEQMTSDANPEYRGQMDEEITRCVESRKAANMASMRALARRRWATESCWRVSSNSRLEMEPIRYPVWAMVARTPKGLVLPPVIIMCIVGVYLPGQSLFDLGVMFVFAGLGLIMRRTGFPVVCLVIGFLLGSMLETSLRQSMLLYKSDFWIIFESPIALGFLILTLVVLLKAAFKR